MLETLNPKPKLPKPTCGLQDFAAFQFKLRAFRCGVEGCFVVETTGSGQLPDQGCSGRDYRGLLGYYGIIVLGFKV